MSAARQLAFFGAERGAVISADGLYRYRLWRRWGTGPHALFVMLNPSTADGSVDDPTIRKCIGFARRWDMEAIEVVNLFALRSTDPAALAKATDPIGPENHSHLAEAGRAASLKIAAWGCRPPRLPPTAFKARVAAARDLVGGGLLCLGKTDAGEPRHPLMLAYETMLQPLEAGAR